MNVPSTILETENRTPCIKTSSGCCCDQHQLTQCPVFSASFSPVSELGWPILQPGLPISKLLCSCRSMDGFCASAAPEFRRCEAGGSLEGAVEWPHRLEA